MKAIFVLAAMIVVSNPVIAGAVGVDYRACAPEAVSCEKPKSCAAFYTCQTKEHRKLSELVLTAISEIDIEQIDACKAKRDELEGTIFAHATTIECVDTPSGPHFGG